MLGLIVALGFQQQRMAGEVAFGLRAGERGADGKLAANVLVDGHLGKRGDCALQGRSEVPADEGGDGGAVLGCALAYLA